MAGIDTYTKLLIHANGTDGSKSFVDSSFTGRVMTAVSNAHIDTARYKFGGASLYIPDIVSYVTALDSDDWNFGSGNFTIDLQWNLDTLNIGRTNAIIAQYGAAGNHSWLWDYSLLGGGVRFFYSSDGINDSAFIWSWLPTADTWYHLALVRSSTSMYFFVDGVQVGTSGNISTTSFFNSTDVLSIGSDSNGGSPSNFHDGWLDEVRISKGIARWTSNFTAPSKEYTRFDSVAKIGYSEIDTKVSLMLHGDGTNGSTTITDSSINTKTMTAYVNAQISTSNSKFSGASIYFDGASYVTTPDHEDYNFGSGDFTVDFWEMVPSSYPSLYSTYVSQIGALGNYGWSIGYAPLSSTLDLFVTSDGSNNVGKNVVITLSVDTWYHIAVVRNGGNLYFFINGVQQGDAQDITGLNIFNSTESLAVGAQSISVTPINFFKGYIDELRISKGIARWTSNFKVPEAPYSLSTMCLKASPSLIIGY